MGLTFVLVVSKQLIKMTKILGLTGGIASGKTTVSNYFKSLDIPVIDGDKTARQLMQTDQMLVKEIEESFGPTVLQVDGLIDRKELGQLVFQSADKRRQLDEIVQPRIRAALLNQLDHLIKQDQALIVLDIPLLYEKKYDEIVDEVMVVAVDFQTQKDRLMKRNPELTETDALNRIQSQLPLEEKVTRADLVIDNNHSIEKTFEQVNEWLEKQDLT